MAATASTAPPATVAVAARDSGVALEEVLSSRRNQQAGSVASRPWGRQSSAGTVRAAAEDEEARMSAWHARHLALRP